MRRQIYMSMVFCFLALSINAQTQEEKTVAQLVQEFNDAIIRTDTSSLRKMTHSRLTYGHSGGNIQDQQAFLMAIMAGPTFFKVIDRKDETVVVTGRNAIVRNIVTAQAINQGKAVEIKFGSLMVWKKKGGKWKLLARQGYKL